MQTKAFLCLSILLYSHSLLAQFARMEDPDGYVNIRSRPAGSSPVRIKVYEDEVFWCFEPEGDWYPVDVFKNGTSVSGYIHQSRVRFIEQLPSVPVRERHANRIVFQNADLRVAFSTRKFVEREHTIQRSHPTGSSFISTIDNRPLWGTDGNMPKEEYSQLTVTLGDQPVAIPKTEITNLFEPNLGSTAVHHDKASGRIYISSTNSDGAGGYVVLWMIKHGKFLSRTTLVPF